MYVCLIVASSHRIVTAVNIISKEDKVGVGCVASDAEKLEEIVELPVDVANYRHRCRHSVHILMGET